MTIEEKKDAVRRLALLIPELTEFQPEGWKDFRDPMQPHLRLGPFIHLWEPSLVGPDIGCPSDGRHLEFKMVVGCKAAAFLLAHKLYIATSHGFKVESMGQYWTVSGVVFEDSVCW